MIQTGNITCRIAENRDLDVLVSLSIRAFSYEINLVGQGPPGFNDIKYFLQSLKEKHCFVLEVDSVVVGGAILKILPNNYIYLSRIFINPDFQGKGLATVFLKYLEMYFPDKIWQLHVLQVSQSVQTFYYKLGYRNIYSEEIGGIKFFVFQKFVKNKESLFIQLTGAQSTGKTTLLNKVSENLNLPKWIPFITISEISRSVHRSLGKVDVNANDYTQMCLNAELLLRRKVILDNNRYNSVIIADRSPICCLSYARHLENPSSYMLDFTESLVKCSRDNIITLYLPPLIPFVSDEIRNKDSRYTIDLEVRNILSEFDYNYQTLNSADLQIRVDAVKKIIYDYFQ